MSEGQRWLWYYHTMTVLMHYDSKRWLEEAGLPLPPELVRPPYHLMQYWQLSGQYAHARAHKPGQPPAPYVHREQINKQPPALPTYEFK